MKVFIEANCVLLAEFECQRGLFIGETVLGTRINAYVIRTGNFATNVNSVSYPEDIGHKALNHDELVDWVKRNYPEFVF